MDNLTATLDQILSDPGSIKQIIDTMSSLGGYSTSADAVEPNQDLTTTYPGAVQKEQKQQALMRALIPYLSPGKQRRLERAMQVAKLSDLAAYAFSSQIFPSEKEDENV